LLLSQGVPMLLAGDELGRTQHGNNNAYCQDNEISWIDWQLNGDDQALCRFVQQLIRLRREHAVFTRRTFFQGRTIGGSGVKDICWLAPDGREMTDEEWTAPLARCLGVYYAGDAINERDRRGREAMDANF